MGAWDYGGFGGLLFGSVGQHCLTHVAVPCSDHSCSRGSPPGDSSGNPHKIVVGVDGSDESNLALDWAASESLRTGAQLEVLGSWVFPGASGYACAASIGVPDAARQAPAPSS